MNRYLFQNCPKLIIFSRDGSKILLCKRKNEDDFNGIFSFPGGKMEIDDKSIIEGIRREKNEELGSEFIIKLFPTFNSMFMYSKKDGNKLLLPHYLAIHIEGEIRLSDEYEVFKWVPIGELESFQPKIKSIPKMVDEIKRLKTIISEKEFSVI